MSNKALFLPSQLTNIFVGLLYFEFTLNFAHIVRGQIKVVYDKKVLNYQISKHESDAGKY